MSETYSKEFIEEYKERIRRIQNGEEFDYPSIFGTDMAMSCTVAYNGPMDNLKGILYNGDKYKPIGKVVDSFISEDGFKCTIRREEEK